MQNDFICGSLKNEAAAEIVPSVAEKIKQFDGIVLFTRDAHEENYLHTQEGHYLPVEHCKKGSEGFEIIEQLADFSKTAVIFDKPAFASLDLVQYLKENYEKEIEEIELVGLCTDICVISNAFLLKAFFPEIKISVDASCCAGVTKESHRNALEAMKQCQIQIVHD